MRTLLSAVIVAALVLVLSLVRATYDDAPSPEQQRCDRLQAAANAVPDVEDTVSDEVTYVRLAKAADRACGRA